MRLWAGRRRFSGCPVLSVKALSSSSAQGAKWWQPLSWLLSPGLGGGRDTSLPVSFSKWSLSLSLGERGKPPFVRGRAGGRRRRPRGHRQDEAVRPLPPPITHAGPLHFHPLIRYIYFLGISLTRIDCAIIAYFFGPLAVNLEARRAEAGRPPCQA